MASHDDSNASAVFENGWRQGAVLSRDLVLQLMSQNQIMPIFGRQGCEGSSVAIDANDDLLMVISQDCDLVQSSWEKEPFAELLRIRIAGNGNLPLPWGQNPREIQFDDPPQEHKPTKYVSTVHERYSISRRFLANAQPDTTRVISEENVKRLCLWVSRRYVRAAFPNNFNARIKRKMDELAKKQSFLDTNRDLLTAVYMRVPDNECAVDETYEIFVWGTMKIDDYQDASKREIGQRVMDLIEATLDECGGIEINECLLKSEQDVSLDHLRTWKRWDYDVLSLKPKTKDGKWPSVSELPPNF